MKRSIRKITNPSLKKHFLTLSFYLLGLTLPWQLGKHFWPGFSYVNGLRIDYLSPTVYLNDIILWSLLLVALITGYFQQNKQKKVGWLGLALLLGINYFQAKNPGLFFYRLYQYAKVLGLVFVFSQSRPKQIKTFFSGLSLSILLAFILSVGQIYHQGSLQGLWYFFGERSFTVNSPGISTVSLNGQKFLRAYAFFSHPNSLAGFFLPLVFIYLALMKPVLAIITIILIVLAFSKFYLVILALGLAYWFVPKKNSCRLCLLAKTMFVLWLVWLALMVKNDPFSLSSRLGSVLPALQFIILHPFGTGLGHYLQPRLPPFPQPVHNVFLLLTLEWGWFVWLWLIVPAKRLWVKLKNNRLSKVVLLILILSAGFDHYLITLNQNLLLLGVLLGLFIGPWSKTQTPS